MNSLGVFHHSLSVSLASFAKRVSAGDHGDRSGRNEYRVDPASTRSTQGRLHLHTALRAPWRDAPHCRFKSASYTDPLTTVGVRPRTRTGLHGNRVGVTMPLEIALSPQAFSTLPPSIHPRLGVSSRHQKFHRCALWRLFRSSLGNGRSD